MAGGKSPKRYLFWILVGLAVFFALMFLGSTNIPAKDRNNMTPIFMDCSLVFAVGCAIGAGVLNRQQRAADRPKTPE